MVFRLIDTEATINWFIGWVQTSNLDKFEFVVWDQSIAWSIGVKWSIPWMTMEVIVLHSIDCCAYIVD